MIEKEDIEVEYTDSGSADTGMDVSGSEVTMEESESSEYEEGTDSGEAESSDGYSDDSVVYIDYEKITTSVREAQTINTIDSDLNNLPLSDVLLLLLAFVLGIIIVRMRR